MTYLGNSENYSFLIKSFGEWDVYSDRIERKFSAKCIDGTPGISYNNRFYIPGKDIEKCIKIHAELSSVALLNGFILDFGEFFKNHIYKEDFLNACDLFIEKL